MSLLATQDSLEMNYIRDMGVAIAFVEAYSRAADRQRNP